jgi:ZIP family zinc transporter
MNIFLPFIISCISGLSTVLGNLLLFINIKYKDKLLSFTMGLTFVVMFLISVLELIPEGIGMIYYRFNYIFIFCISLLFLMIGYILVNIIESRIECSSNLYKIGILSMLSVFIHNVPEGIICSLTGSIDIYLGLKICFIIMIHNIPEGICIGLPIYYSSGSRGKAFLFTLISSLGEIFGAFLGIIFYNYFANNLVLSIMLFITAGIMISLSIGKILKEGLSYKCHNWFIYGILVGFGVIILTL